MAEEIKIKIGGEENMKNLYKILRAFLEKKCKKAKPKIRLQLCFTIDNTKIKGESMSVLLLPGQFATVQIQPLDRREKPAKVEAGTVKWASSDEAVFTIEQDADDETKATVRYAGDGVAQLDVTADADLGEGVKELSVFAAIECQPDQAASLAIQFGEPQDA